MESILKNNPENLNWKKKNYLKVPEKMNMEFAAKSFYPETSRASNTSQTRRNGHG